MTRVQWWLFLVLISICIVGLDLVTGPYLMFPIAFIVPVGLASWHLGRWPSIVFAAGLVVARLAVVAISETQVTPLWAAVVNADIRFIVLAGFGVLIAKVAEQQRMLAARVQILEGILPICAFCKKIRRADGKWEAIEVYVGKRSSAQFTHGFCEACGKEQYGEYVSEAAAPRTVTEALRETRLA